MLPARILSFRAIAHDGVGIRILSAPLTGQDCHEVTEGFSLKFQHLPEVNPSTDSRSPSPFRGGKKTALSTQRIKL